MALWYGDNKESATCKAVNMKALSPLWNVPMQMDLCLFGSSVLSYYFSGKEFCLSKDAPLQAAANMYSRNGGENKLN